MERKKYAFFENNSWYHRVKRINSGGKTIYTKKGGFKTEKEAIENYFKMIEIFESDKNKLINKDRNYNITFSEYLKYWLEDMYKPRIRSTTFMSLSYIIYGLIIPNIKLDISINLVSENYLISLLEIVTPISKTAASESKKALYLAFKDAKIDGYIKYNPIKNIKGFKYDRPKYQIFNESELKLFLNYVKDSKWYLEILLALFCGLRKGEIIGLKLSDFNTIDKTVKIERQLTYSIKMEKGTIKVKSYNIVERTPKSINSLRILSIPDVIIDAYNKRLIKINYLKHNDNYIDKDYLCVQNNGKPVSMNALNSYLNRVCTKLAITRISVHGLRHMFATLLIENDVPLAKISALLGHSSIHTTYDYYINVINDKEKIYKFINDTYNDKEI